ncbi:bifunctional 2-polyprenyl-6-hydroxyphenol methylase/3-demethylubiquinol 3-O-methyltransferase UbiG [Polynucleobacter sp. Fuers-14]|uniref:class I SAM-dependent methyltransferase n=1 Tax=Polynucleobacter sp. Fuers-14 TaxID=1758364 RepID=UPI002105BBAA|nr:SAM-dependent methyltransferase [Polynucleobacter sp. Fuers-14]
MPSPHDAILNASPWVRRFAPLIQGDGVVLDLACGSGRHSDLLASMGHAVLAVDQDVTAVGSLSNLLITPKHLNLEEANWPLIGFEFSAILVTNYLFRPHLDQLPKMLQQDGVLIYETFALGNGAFGKPSNPNFLLNPGELLTFASRHGLKVVAYEDIYVDQPKPAMVQRLCAVKGELKQHIPLQFQG